MSFTHFHIIISYFRITLAKFIQMMEGNLDDGLTISHYVLGKTIGKGGFAKVKQGIHTITNTAVAVKILNKVRMKNINMISKVKRQVKILKFLNHPNIIKLYEVLDSTSDIFVVMEMASGGELYQYIQKNNLSEEEIKGFFRQILDGVQHAHLNLVSHRDLKPENILLDQNNNIKIADFGLSNLMKDGKMLKTFCGSLNYAAPEIIGKRYYEGTSVDVWSCGVILYTMLAGSLPFDQEVVTLLYNKISNAQYTIPNFISPLASDLLHRILQVNPCKRLTIHQIKKHPWLKTKLPLYMKISVFTPHCLNENLLIDDQIFKIIKDTNSEVLKRVHDDERIKLIIKRKLDDSFVVAYELLKSKKDEDSYFKRQKELQNHQMNIFKPFPNLINEKQLAFSYDGSFGKTYKLFPQNCVDLILKVFKQMSIHYILKNNQYCFMCQTLIVKKKEKIPKKTYSYEENVFGYRDLQRFNKLSFKFSLQVYTVSKRPSELLIDAKLTQGHPMVFMKLMKKFYEGIDNNIDS